MASDTSPLEASASTDVEKQGHTHTQRLACPSDTSSSPSQHGHTAVHLTGTSLDTVLLCQTHTHSSKDPFLHTPSLSPFFLTLILKHICHYLKSHRVVPHGMALDGCFGQTIEEQVKRFSLS